MRCMHRSCDVCIDHTTLKVDVCIDHTTLKVDVCIDHTTLKVDVCIDQIMQQKYLWTMMPSMVTWSQCDVHVTSSMTSIVTC